LPKGEIRTIENQKRKRNNREGRARPQDARDVGKTAKTGKNEKIRECYSRGSVPTARGDSIGVQVKRGKGEGGLVEKKDGPQDLT